MAAKKNNKTKRKDKQEIDQIETFQLGNVIYSKDSITEKGNGMFNDIGKIDSVISGKELEITIMKVARGKIIEELQKEALNFTAVGKVGDEGNKNGNS